MKKLLLLMVATMMALSFSACGGEEESEAPSTDEAVVAEDQVADEQAKADEDYAQLQGFMNGITEIYAGQQEIVAMLEEVKSGQREESDLLQGYQLLAEMSENLLTDVENATWITNYYDDKVIALTDCVTALALYQQTVYEAGAENDNAKLEEAVGYYEDYDAKLGEFLDIMGVE